MKTRALQAGILAVCAVWAWVGEASAQEASATGLKSAARDGGGAQDAAAMVFVPAGEFLRGSDDGESDEKPTRQVYVDAFAIDRTEVTVDAYAACVRAGACSKPSCSSPDANWGVAGRGQHPVNCVDWTQADTYCRWAGKRLPTEAEWEKAARGTDGRTYPWGNQAPSCRYAVMNDGGKGCGEERTWAVGSKPAGASPYGALDMSGNVWEWVSDGYSSSAYAGAASARNPKGPSSGSLRVFRGGSFGVGDAAALRAAYRLYVAPSYAGDYLGFRCARSMP